MEGLWNEADGGAAQRNIEETQDLIGTKSRVAGYFVCFQCEIGQRKECEYGREEVKMKRKNVKY